MRTYLMLIKGRYFEFLDEFLKHAFDYSQFASSEGKDLAGEFTITTPEDSELEDKSEGTKRGFFNFEERA